jgi:predicted nucleic acid-binding Zn ribbon protein
MRTRKAVSLEDLLKGAIRSLKKKARVTQEEMADIWKGAVGSAASSHTKPVALRKTGLSVNVDSSGWLYELTTQKKEILRKLDGKIKGKKIKEIRFRIGEIE